MYIYRHHALENVDELVDEIVNEVINKIIFFLLTERPSDITEEDVKKKLYNILFSTLGKYLIASISGCLV